MTFEEFLQFFSFRQGLSLALRTRELVTSRSPLFIDIETCH